MKNDISFFMSLMFHRVPSFKDHVESFLKETVNAMRRFMMRKGTLPPPPPSLAKLIEEHGDQIIETKISNWKVIETIYDAAIHSAFIPAIEKMKLSILKAPEECYFITSDSPVVFFDPNYHKKEPYGVGFLHKDIQISMALDSHHLILASWDDVPKNYDLTPDEVQEFNRRVVIMGERFVYSPYSDNLVHELIKNNYKYKAGHDLSTLEHDDGFVHINRIIPVTNN